VRGADCQMESLGKFPRNDLQAPAECSRRESVMSS
jgi:hypothetical protein